MTDTLTDEQIDEIEARAEAVMPQINVPTMITADAIIKAYSPSDTLALISALRAERAEVERLRELVKNFARQVEMLAFDMSPPNKFTPDFVMAANAARALSTKGAGNENT